MSVRENINIKLFIHSVPVISAFGEIDRVEEMTYAIFLNMNILDLVRFVRITDRFGRR